MTPTDELCRLLDELGVEWMPSVWSAKDETFYKVGDVGYLATELSSGRMKVCIEGYPTPEQAVEAALGPRITGETSDGYHTFNELYHHRAMLFSVIVRDHKELAWKSKLHHDGTMYDGMFIVGIETPQGQATYHYDTDQYWDMFDCKELERAPEWDGHSPSDAIDRIATLGSDNSYTREDVEGAFVSGYSLGLDMFDYSKPDAEKGWNQNERELDEEMEERGWVRKEATTHRPLTERAEKDSEKDSDRCGECQMELDFSHWDDDLGWIRSWTCSECGESVLLMTEGKPSCCPHCGRKVKED